MTHEILTDTGEVVDVWDQLPPAETLNPPNGNGDEDGEGGDG